MSAPPVDVDTPLKAALMPATASKFKAAADWAQGEPQKAVLAAVKKVTEAKDYKSAYAIGQGYGANAVDPDAITTNMWTDLGTPELLTSANFMYIPKLRDVFTLLHVEATRLAADGKAWEAMELTVSNLYLARQVADRAFFAEQLPGLQAAVLALNRIRDIAYQDITSGSPKLTAENMRSVIEQHNDVKLLGIKRLTLARADAIGIEQLIGYVFEKGGKPNRDFAPFLARLSSRDRPLRAFSETAKWEAIAPLHASEAETRQKVADVFGDWNNRWKLDPFDPKLKLPTDYVKLDNTRFALVEQFLRRSQRGLHVPVPAACRGRRHRHVARHRRLPPRPQPVPARHHLDPPRVHAEGRSRSLRPHPHQQPPLPRSRRQGRRQPLRDPPPPRLQRRALSQLRHPAARGHLLALLSRPRRQPQRWQARNPDGPR